MENVTGLLENYSDKVVQQMKRILLSNRKRATGQLTNSIKYSINNNSIITFSFKSYGDYVISGRKPNSKMPPPDSILAWMKVKRISVGNNRTKSLVKKGKKQPKEKQLQRMAFAIARGISKKGIQPLDFTTPLQVFSSDKFKTDLTRAMAEDMKQTLINGINNK